MQCRNIISIPPYFFGSANILLVSVTVQLDCIDLQYYLSVKTSLYTM